MRNSRSIRQEDFPEVLAVAGDIAEPGVAERVVSGALEKFGRVNTLAPPQFPAPPRETA